MFTMVFDIEYSGILAEPRGWKTIRREAYREAGRAWHRKFAAKHFTHPGAKKYGYTPRSGQEHAFGSNAFSRSYTGQKWRKKRHTNPLVWSGETKRLVLTNWRIQSHRNGAATVIMNAPGLNLRNPKSTINMREEMERITQDEVHYSAGRAQVRADSGLKALSSTRRKRRRIRS